MTNFQSSILKLSKEIESLCSKDIARQIDTSRHKELTPLVIQINKLFDTDKKRQDNNGEATLQTISPDQEKQLLSAFISKLPQGIIVCDASGAIQLFNDQIQIFFTTADERPALKQGQAITALIDKNYIEHALDEINSRLKRGITETRSHFIIQTNGLILQAHMIAVLNESNHFTGFILFFSDITQQSNAEKRIESLLHNLSQNARSPLASIRAAIEAITEFPQMETGKKTQLEEIIRKESVVLNIILDQVSDTYGRLAKTKNSLKTISAQELLETFCRRSSQKLGIKITILVGEKEEGIFLNAEPFSFITALLSLMKNLKETIDIWEYECTLVDEIDIVTIDISWSGKPIQPDMLKRWENTPLEDTEDQSPHLNISDILSHHHATIGTYTGGEETKNRSYIRIFLTSQQMSAPPLEQTITLLPESRSQISELALFDHPSQSPELDERLMTELAYTSLIREIQNATSTEEVMGKHSQLPRLIHNMITSGTKIRTVTWLVSAFADAILTKLLDFGIEQLGPPPVPFTFLCLGSEGRNEQTLKTDQDNAIVYLDTDTEKEGEAAQSYFLELGEKVCIWLDQAGYDLCRGGIMAQNPQWCQPLSVWKNNFSTWLQTTEPENILHSTIFFDFRAAYGDKNISDALSDHLFRTLEGKTNFFRCMTQSSMNFKPPIGIFGNFHLSSDKEYKNCLDIKKAITPLVDFARLFSLFNGIKENSTQDRMYQLYRKRVFSRAEYNEMEQMYSFLMQVRFMGQIDATIQHNTSPHNYINPKHLSTIEKKMLKEIFVKTKDMQGKLCLEFTGATNCQL